MKKLSLNDITIRTELKSGDLGYVTYLHGKLYNNEYGYDLGFESYVAKSLNEFYTQYDSKNNRVWFCEHNDKIIGHVFLMNRGDAAQLRYFLIEPAYRGIGLGRKLIELYMDFLKQCGYKKSYLLTTHELPTASHIYVMHGFKLVEQYESTAFGKPLIEQRYELSL